ncbi:MAG: LysR substrate-binding domain-containing protein [Actinomycetota bacterium]
MNYPTLRQLEYLVALVEHNHFGRAAEAAHISQPALSAQLRELETRLDATLIERDRRASRPTPVGIEVARRARLILGELDDLMAVAGTDRDALYGTVRMAAIPTIAPYLFPTVTAAARVIWPDATLELSELRSRELVDAVDHGAADIGLMATPFDTGRLHVSTVIEEDFVLAMPEHHDLADGGPLPLSALATLPVLLLEDGHCLHDHALAVCRLAGASDHATVRSASLSTLTQMVAAGAGVTLLPTSALPVETRPGTGISVRRFEPPAPSRTITLVWRTSDPRGSHYEHLADRLR